MQQTAKNTHFANLNLHI